LEEYIVSRERDPSIQRQEELLAEIAEEEQSVFETPTEQQRPEVGNPEQIDQTFLPGEDRPEII
jgi:hypothetical protein